MKIVQPQPQTLSLNIGDADLQYLYYHGRGPAIIFQHATGFLPWLWHPIARQLSGAYRIIAPYFCDHRQTSPLEGGMSWIRLAEDLSRLWDRLHIDHIVLIGHSMGATVMTLAEALFGPRAAGMLLMEPIFYPQDYYTMSVRLKDHPLALKSMRRRSTWTDRDEAKRYLKSKTLFEKWDEEMLELYLDFGMDQLETGGLELSCPPASEAALFLGGQHYDPWPLLPSIQCPVLILEGDESGNRQIINLPSAVDRFPKGNYQRIKNAGHLIPMEKPGEMVDTIRSFMQLLDLG